MTIGERLKDLRKQYNLTQKELADILEVSKSSVAKYETNRRKLDLEKLLHIANYFNVTTDYILSYSPKSPIENKELQEYNEVYKVPVQKKIDKNNIVTEENIIRFKYISKISELNINKNFKYFYYITNRNYKFANMYISKGSNILVKQSDSIEEGSLILAFLPNMKKPKVLIFNIIYYKNKEFLISQSSSLNNIKLYKKKDLQVVGNIIQIIQNLYW